MGYHGQDSPTCIKMTLNDFIVISSHDIYTPELFHAYHDMKYPVSLYFMVQRFSISASYHTGDGVFKFFPQLSSLFSPSSDFIELYFFAISASVHNFYSK